MGARASLSPAIRLLTLTCAATAAVSMDRVAWDMKMRFGADEDVARVNVESEMGFENLMVSECFRWVYILIGRRRRYLGV